MAHFFLAFKYQGISKRVPEALNGEESEPPNTCDKAGYWGLFAANIVFALMRGIFLIIIFLKFPERRSTPVIIVKIICTTSMQVCAIIAGVMLVAGVIRIRRFFREKEADDVLNSSMLVRHAIAFSLYLLSTSAWLIAVALDNIFRSAWSVRLYEQVSIADYIVQFVAQVMLLEILWQWGRKYVDATLAEEEEMRVFKPVRATEFEPDFDLDALIWNTIIKKRLNDIEGNMYTVSVD